MNQGEVWLVDFAPAVGQEIRKERPAVIVNNNAVGRLELKIVVPITEASRPAVWHAPLSPSATNGLTKPCFADCFQVKSISHNRFSQKMGELSVNEMDEIKLALALVLDMV